MLGELISAGVNLAGQFMGQSNVEKNNATQLQIAAQNNALQKEFAQQGIQWKVADAKAAGIHPLAALGATTTSFSPQSVGTEAFKPDFSSLGQDLGRAFKAAQSSEIRKEADEAEMRRLDLENRGLQNDVLRAGLASKIARQTGQLGPGMPTGGVDGVPRGALAHLSRSPFRQSGIAVAEDEMKAKEASGPGVKRLPLWGVLPIDTYPNRATGQDLENEYGEYGGGILAAPNVVPDLIHTYGGYPRDAALSIISGLSSPGVARRVKRFRRGSYTAPSYRPWYD